MSLKSSIPKLTPKESS